MNIEIRKNGTFYLKHSTYNSATKLPKNTSIYLGSNPIQAKNKLKALTDDLALLEQIPDVLPYEVEIDKVIRDLQKLNNLQAEGIRRIINEYLDSLIRSKQFIHTAKKGVIAPTIDCPDCRFKNENLCTHFEHTFINGNGKYKDGKAIRCIAFKLGETKPNNGSIKLPRDFRIKK
jgi:hypothetical protein